jgi:hypothetical protein
LVFADVHGPAVLVQDVVVVVAAEHGVVQGGGSAVGPVVDVVDLGPLGWGVAAGEGAAAVAGDQRAA